MIKKPKYKTQVIDKNGNHMDISNLDNETADFLASSHGQIHIPSVRKLYITINEIIEKVNKLDITH